MSRATKVKPLQTLLPDGDNFNTWELCLEHSLYWLGYLPWYLVTLDPANAPAYAQPADLARDEADTQIVWTFITSSLAPKLLENIRPVPFGQIGQLIVAIRQIFYKATPANQALLRDQIIACTLAAYEDVDDYIAAMRSFFSRLASMGEFDSENSKIHRLMLGLPDCDYGQLKATMKLPRQGLPPLSEI